jgi:hypothetical protein
MFPAKETRADLVMEAPPYSSFTKDNVFVEPRYVAPLKKVRTRLEQPIYIPPPPESETSEEDWSEEEEGEGDVNGYEGAEDEESEVYRGPQEYPLPVGSRRGSLTASFGFNQEPVARSLSRSASRAASRRNSQADLHVQQTMEDRIRSRRASNVSMHMSSDGVRPNTSYHGARKSSTTTSLLSSLRARPGTAPIGPIRRSQCNTLLMDALQRASSPQPRRGFSAKGVRTGAFQHVNQQVIHEKSVVTKKPLDKTKKLAKTKKPPTVQVGVSRSLTPHVTKRM